MEQKDLICSVYEFLIRNGHSATANSLIKETKLDKNLIKSKTFEKLEDVFSLKYFHIFFLMIYQKSIFKELKYLNSGVKGLLLWIQIPVR